MKLSLLVILLSFSIAGTASAEFLSKLNYAHCTNGSDIDLEITKSNSGPRNFEITGKVAAVLYGQRVVVEMQGAKADGIYYATKASSLLRGAHDQITFWPETIGITRIDIDQKRGQALIGSPYPKDEALQCEIR